MLRATVTGAVWSTKRLDALPAGALLEVRTLEGATLVAFDVLGSGIGEEVLVATGSVASGYFAPEHPPLDALIIGSLDEPRSPGDRGVAGGSLDEPHPPGARGAGAGSLDEPQRGGGTDQEEQ
jgi:ethanolamine utilization protein EutN